MEAREIKFRAWDIDGSEMFYAKERTGSDAWFFDFVNGTLQLMLSVEDNYPEIRNAAIQQFTGSCDGNGKEIYEGDILKETIQGGLFNWLVIFKNGCFGIRNIGIDGYMNHNEFFPINSEYYFMDREVIGNIYENPELLK